MSWINELYGVYERNKAIVGDSFENCVLLPVYHNTQSAQIQVNLTSDGIFVDAFEVADDDKVTLIPVTEDSATRGSGIAPHPLCDKLIYIAGDYNQYTNSKNDKKVDDCFYAYILALEKWSKSEFSHPSVRAIYEYLKQGSLIKDLSEAGILKLTDSGKLDESHKINKIAQAEAFVRFAVYDQELYNLNCVWKDKSLYQCFIEYYSSLLETVDICYATGKRVPCTYKHISKTRNAGDGTKIISSNDETNFTFRGRFFKKEEAYTLGSEVSQEAHLALRWLIQRQGRSFGNFTLVSWERNLQPIPDVLSSSLSFIENGSEDNDETEYCETKKEYSLALGKAVAGYYQKLKPDSKIMVMGLDSPSDKGRLSIVMYRELDKTYFFENIKNWYQDCSWYMRYRNEKKELVNTIGTPSLYRIVSVIFGTERNGMFEIKPELRKYILKQMLPCIADGAKIPEHVLKMAKTRASSPQMYSSRYSWEEVLDITCALYHKFYLHPEKYGLKKNGVDYSMELDLNNHDRSYLYGRLLAVADRLEYVTYDKSEDDKRMTNAKRYMQAFIANPFKTWNGIYKNLYPYYQKLKAAQRIYYENLFSEITLKFNDDDYTQIKPLDSSFFFGFYSQAKALKDNKIKDDKNDENSKEND